MKTKTDNEKAEKLREQLWWKIKKIDMPRALQIEVKWILNALNYYKLENLEDNLDYFIGYIERIVHNYQMEMVQEM